MKLHSLITAVVLGMAILVQAQTGPDPQTSKSASKFTGEVGPQQILKGADPIPENLIETLNLKAGPLTEVVAQVERYFKNDPKKPDVELPNLIYSKDIGDAVVPGDLTLRRVTPVQALALVSAAAGCTFQPIFAPDEKAGQKTMIIGYRIVLPGAANAPDNAMLKAPTRARSSEPSDLAEEGLAGGIGITLTKTERGVAVGHASPGSPASQNPAVRPGRLIQSVAEAGKPDVDVTGLEPDKVTQLIRGRPGTQVKLTFAPDSESSTRQTVQLVRVKLPASPASTSVPQVSAFGSPTVGGASGGKPLRFTNIQAGENAPFVRVYAIGFMKSGTDAELVKRIQNLEELLGQTLIQAGLHDQNPNHNFHVKTGTFMAKATTAQHEIIEQVIKALKENEADTGLVLDHRRNQIIEQPVPIEQAAQAPKKNETKTANPAKP